MDELLGSAAVFTNRYVSRYTAAVSPLFEVCNFYSAMQQHSNYGAVLHENNGARLRSYNMAGRCIRDSRFFIASRTTPPPNFHLKGHNKASSSSQAEEQDTQEDGDSS